MTDLERKKLEIEIIMQEYEDAIRSALAWHRGWKAQRMGFRATRRHSDDRYCGKPNVDLS